MVVDTPTDFSSLSLFYEALGYVFLDALTEEECERIVTQVQDVVKPFLTKNAQSKTGGVGPTDTYGKFRGSLGLLEGESPRPAGLLDFYEYVDQVLIDGDLTQRVSTILKENVRPTFIGYYEQAIASELHVDGFNTACRAQLWIPLRDLSLDQGPLYFFEETHVIPEFHTTLSSPVDASDLKNLSHFERRPTYRAGCGPLFHPNLVHASINFPAEFRRPVILIHYGN